MSYSVKLRQAALLSVAVLGMSVTSPLVTVTGSANTNTGSSSVQTFDLARYDAYVEIRNNQYVVNDAIHSVADTGEVSRIEDAINKANEQVLLDQQTIDLETKSTSPDIGYAAWNKNYTYANFWWGTRYYFTSNQAVAQMSYQLNNYSLLCGLGAAVGGGIASLIGVVGAAYFSSVANGLNYYNACHMKNQIYMDVNYTAQYSFHVLA